MGKFLAGLCLAASVAAPLWCSADEADLAPNPDLTPQQVVEYQLNALRHNDEPKANTGIERAFRFASPANREFTGPIDHFILIVHAPQYAYLLHAQSSTIKRSNVEGEMAKFQVEVIDQDGNPRNYVFVLSKQESGEYLNCWMTDQVLKLEDPPSDSVSL